MSHLLLATHNAGKLRELQALTAETTLVCHSLAEFPGAAPAVETGATFAENARAKALHYADQTGMFTLADDSGLAVDALRGAPGVHSARYAGVQGDDAGNNRKLLAALAGRPNAERVAHFRCAMAFARPGAVLLEAEGSVTGQILESPRGSNGFGYDPLFLLPDLGRTMAELPDAQKNTLSHRGQALRAILPQILHWFATRAP